jgi:hypothetical protein
MHYFTEPGQNGRSKDGLSEHIQTIGIRWREYRGAGWWGEFETAGAYGGKVDGLAQVFAGASYEFCRQGAWRCHAGLMLGSAGGGDVHSGGGVLGRVLVGGQRELGRHWQGLFEVGQTSALNAPFNAFTVTFGLGYRYETLLSKPGEVSGWSDNGHWKRNRVRAGVQRYFADPSSLRKSGVGEDYVDLLTLKLDSFVSRQAFLTGQALGAFDGEAGGYAVGLLGAGYQYPLAAGFFLEGELTAGAGGGGGISAGDGLLIQPMVSFGKVMTSQLSLALQLGYVTSWDAELSADVVEISMNYRFEVPRIIRGDNK